MQPSKKSAGIILFRQMNEQVKVLLVHPGGPFWKNKDDGAWSIPKGEFTDEEPFTAALRELKEEVGVVPEGEFIELTPEKQGGGKWVYAWAVECDCDVSRVQSNTFTMEWPSRSGKMATFPEIDRAAWFSLDEARRKILSGQLPLIEELSKRLGDSTVPE